MTEDVYQLSSRMPVRTRCIRSFEQTYRLVPEIKGLTVNTTSRKERGVDEPM
jgi:hypothetical protein